MILGRAYITRTAIGPFRRRLCQHCHNEGYWQAEGKALWLAVCSVPLIPLGFEHRLICPVCHQGHRISRSDYRKLRVLAGVNSRFKSGEISAEQYDAEVTALELRIDNVQSLC